MGLEVHVELGTKTKMFCGCSTEFGAEPNTQACPVCLGLPGALPVVNEKAVESAIRIGLALNCEIAEWCRFARKNYFYPDMPKNFQTSQYDEPIAFDGYLDVQLEDGEIFRVEIERAHMEEDTGKSLHVGGATGRIHGADYSLLDYNRAGIPLIEIVTKPIEGAGERAPEVAKAYVAELRELFKALGVSEARMEQGPMRCDVNLSLRPPTGQPGRRPLGTRTETKNVNSLRSVERAVRFEIQRHAAVLDSGGDDRPGDPALPRGHRRHDVAAASRTTPRTTATSRSPTWCRSPRPRVGRGAARRRCPSCRALRRRRLQAEWGVTDHDMRDILNAGARRPDRGDGRAGRHARGRPQVVDGRAGPARQRAGRRPRRRWPSRPGEVAGVARWSTTGTLNDKLARQVLEGVLAGEGTPDEVVEARGLEVVSDDGALGAAVDEAIAANPDIADKIRGGKVAGGRRAGRRGHEGDAGPGRRRQGTRDHPGRGSARAETQWPYAAWAGTRVRPPGVPAHRHTPLGALGGRPPRKPRRESHLSSVRGMAITWSSSAEGLPRAVLLVTTHSRPSGAGTTSRSRPR